MNSRSSIVWGFVDLFLLLSVAFLIATEVQSKESSESDRFAPKIHLFIEQAGKESRIKCNGRYINDRELSRIVRMALQKDVHNVEVIAMIEANVPYGFVDNVKRAALSSKIASNNEENRLTVVWDTRILSSYTNQ